MSEAEHPTEQAFLQSIRASPLDRLPRLVDADWLDERGDDRAEFLRLQCQVVAGLERLTELFGNLSAGWAIEVDLFSRAMTILRLPILGDGTDRATVIAHHAKPGQRFNPGEIIVEVETDKAQIGCPAEHPCVVILFLAAVGQPVPVGAPLALLLRV